MTAVSSLCINVIGGSSGVAILLVAEIIFYIFGLYYRFKSPPFPEEIWNIRTFTTLSLSLLFYVTNSSNYFLPQLTSYSMNLAYFGGLTIILIEHKLSGSVIGKRFRTTISNKTYSESIDDFEPRPKRPFLKLELQDWVFIGFFIFSIVSMTVFNAIAAQRMPITNSLPDIIHERFQCGERIRGSPDFKKTQFSNLLCALLIPALVVLAYSVPEVTNNRKVFILYAIMCWARGMAFTVTSLPAPCSGLSNCPCADPKSIAYINTFNPLMVAVIWVFGLGMFAPIPQCGDLIVSGHTMFMVLTFKWFVEVSRRIVRKSTVRIVQFHCAFTFFLAISYIILARNHYTVDVFFGWLISETFYELYAYLEKKAVFTSNKSLLVRFVRWFEIRELPIYRKNFEDDDIEPIELFMY
ncbi:hypothetical protein TVAG_458580 [Trichomonas vaginalis G3]|uniref:Sphingomyelin synthase-like domain-containing protein n=1 Tax=Trichomonas vaginalis (strain ATCC PRA-98 / G3) TaxID=412133 RepID=A2G7M4_TRIV3|nr:sphingomyelin synthase protein [Trichomonas vaginalis G3]EAX86846.1 hypothetical protein TVAG_458580 [Trichomonas vaginalis G3]KAI5552532.1 sphingomyelin synthase protein [Trichomonas vaginalis G3]|eukprot:XP_001299776.1 hypothetical protein [Trichomonas vaginalis G3]